MLQRVAQTQHKRLRIAQTKHKRLGRAQTEIRQCEVSGARCSTNVAQTFYGSTNVAQTILNVPGQNINTAPLREVSGAILIFRITLEPYEHKRSTNGT